MNIVLIGMRGSGKSTIGKILAQRLKTDLIETDSLIEKSEGQKIKDIVAKKGWNSFRSLERNIIASLKDRDNVVIATGGGVVLDKKNINILKKNGILIYLHASTEELLKRIKHAGGRPFLTNTSSMKKDIEDTFKLRKNLYENAANMIIDTQYIDLKHFTKDTQLFGVIGNPVSQSLSPNMHNAAFQKMKLKSMYIPFHVINLEKSLQGLKMLGITGLSVTIPFKIEVMKYLNNIDETAKNIGAVNTILVRNNKLFGTNTDWIGAVKALEEKTSLSGKTVVILGDGGGSRAIAFGLRKNDATIIVLNRKQLHENKELAKIKTADIVINATPLGMSPDENQLPMPEAFITNQHIIFDIVFKPRETKLLKIAKKKDATIVYGERMLLYQAVEQFKLFTGLDAPVEIMDKALFKLS